MAAANASPAKSGSLASQVALSDLLSFCSRLKTSSCDHSERCRGSAEKVGQAVAKTYDASVGKFIELMKIPTLRATILSQTLLYFVLASNAFWLPILLHRRFDLTASQGGLLAGVVIVLAGLVGTLGGGWIADHFGNLQKVMRATTDDLDAVEGVGDTRARAIKEGLTRLAESSILDRYS